MKIQVHELKAIDLVHSATTERRMIIKAIRPHIYKHLSPSGTFTMTISQNGDDLGSKDFTSASIEGDGPATATNYFHGPVALIFDSPIVVNRGAFEITLSSSGYTFSEAAYIGWIAEHENIVNNFTSTGNTLDNPLSVEIWSYQ